MSIYAVRTALLLLGIIAASGWFAAIWLAMSVSSPAVVEKMITVKVPVEVPVKVPVLVERTVTVQAPLSVQQATPSTKQALPTSIGAASEYCREAVLELARQRGSPWLTDSPWYACMYEVFGPEQLEKWCGSTRFYLYGRSMDQRQIDKYTQGKGISTVWWCTVIRAPSGISSGR